MAYYIPMLCNADAQASVNLVRNGTDNEPEQQGACREHGHENTVNYKRPAVKVRSDNKKI